MSMRIDLDGQAIDVRPHETLLEACLRQGLALAHSCRAGSCQQCLLRCAEGRVPEGAARHLPAHLRERAYLLACQCHPETDMHLEAPRATDQITDAMLLSVRPAPPAHLWLQFETTRALDARAGQWLQLLQADGAPLELQISHAEPELFRYEGLLHLGPDGSWPAGWSVDAFGLDLRWRGPLDAAPGDPSKELAMPEPDPALWAELGEGRIVRQVLDDFYAHVYQDPQLSPFFRGITPHHVAGKQYAFMHRAMTGQPGYFGDRPHNAHHRMVISDALFDHRQALMEAALRRAGLDAVQIARWTRFELHFRADIVKREPWPRLLREGERPALDGYVLETLETGNVCDHCGEAVDAGAQVLYHQRLGQISCARCAPQAMTGAPTALAG